MKTLKIKQNKIRKVLQRKKIIHVPLFGKAEKKYTFLLRIWGFLNAIVFLDIMVEIDKITIMVETHLNPLSFRLLKSQAKALKVL